MHNTMAVKFSLEGPSKDPCCGLTGVLEVLGRPFFSTTPLLTPITPQLTIQHNTIPTFPALCRAHKKLCEAGVREMAARSPRTPLLPSGSVGASPRLRDTTSLARSDAAGAPPGGRIRSAVPGCQVASTCRRREPPPLFPSAWQGTLNTASKLHPRPCPGLRVTFASRS